MHREREGGYRQLLPERLSSGGARVGLFKPSPRGEGSHDPTIPAGRRHKKYRPSRRTIGILVGEDGFPLTGINFDSIFPAKKNTNHPKRVIGIFGGGRWIRTIEGIASRFTVCPLWPLGNSPICNLSEGGAGRRTRTPDLLITNQLLYQLSYTSTTPAYVS